MRWQHCNRLKDPKELISVRNIALDEYTNIFRLQNKINFSLLIQLNLIPNALILGYIFRQLDKCPDFWFTTMVQGAIEHCFIIIGKSWVSRDAIIFGKIAIYSKILMTNRYLTRK